MNVAVSLKSIVKDEGHSQPGWVVTFEVYAAGEVGFELPVLVTQTLGVGEAEMVRVAYDKLHVLATALASRAASGPDSYA